MADDLVYIDLMDKPHASYRRLRLGWRDIVERYVKQLEYLYEDHSILARAQAIEQEIHHQMKLCPEDQVVLSRIFVELNNLDKDTHTQRERERERTVHDVS